MNYTAIYEDSWDQNGTSEDGTRVTHEVRLGISSNDNLSIEQIKETLRCYLTERLKIGEIKEEKIRIE
jgi:hypothetical protein